MTPDQIAKWNDPLREPFRLFQTIQEELAATAAFWRNRTPIERLEYLEFMRGMVFGENAVNAKTIRCHGRRKLNEDTDPKNIVYF